MPIFPKDKENHHQECDPTNRPLSEFRIQTMTRIIDGERLYTVTIKPTASSMKTRHNLEVYAERYVNKVQGNVLMYTFEKMGSPRVHLHMLIQCPLIVNKAHVASTFKGFHIHTEIIRKNNEDHAINQWERYINKETSDSEFYWTKYGNMFLPASNSDDEGVESESDKTSSSSSNIIHYK